MHFIGENVHIIMIYSIKNHYVTHVVYSDNNKRINPSKDTNKIVNKEVLHLIRIFLVHTTSTQVKLSITE